MAKWMTIKEALEELDMFALYDDVIESWINELENLSPLEVDLNDLLEEHDEEYEFFQDQDGDWTESFERNLKEAITIILEEQGHIVDDEFSNGAMDDEDMDDLYEDGFDEDPEKSDRRNGADLEDYDDYDKDDDYF